MSNSNLKTLSGTVFDKADLSQPSSSPSLGGSGFGWRRPVALLVAIFFLMFPCFPISLSFWLFESFWDFNPDIFSRSLNRRNLTMGCFHKAPEHKNLHCSLFRLSQSKITRQVETMVELQRPHFILALCQQRTMKASQATLKWITEDVVSSPIPYYLQIDIVSLMEWRIGDDKSKMKSVSHSPVFSMRFITHTKRLSWSMTHDILDHPRTQMMATDMLHIEETYRALTFSIQSKAKRKNNFFPHRSQAPLDICCRSENLPDFYLPCPSCVASEVVSDVYPYNDGDSKNLHGVRSDQRAFLMDLMGLNHLYYFSWPLEFIMEGKEELLANSYWYFKLGPVVNYDSSTEHNFSSGILLEAFSLQPKHTVLDTTNVPYVLSSTAHVAIIHLQIQPPESLICASSLPYLRHQWYVLIIGLSVGFGSVFRIGNSRELVVILGSPIRSILLLVGTLFGSSFYFVWWVTGLDISLRGLISQADLLFLSHWIKLRQSSAMIGSQVCNPTSLSDEYSRLRESLIVLPLFKRVIIPGRLLIVRRFNSFLECLNLIQAALRRAINLDSLRLPPIFDSSECLEHWSHRELCYIDSDIHFFSLLLEALSRFSFVYALIASISCYANFIVNELFGTI